MKIPKVKLFPLFLGGLLFALVAHCLGYSGTGFMRSPVFHGAIGVLVVGGFRWVSHTKAGRIPIAEYTLPEEVSK